MRTHNAETGQIIKLLTCDVSKKFILSMTTMQESIREHEARIRKMLAEVEAWEGNVTQPEIINDTLALHATQFKDMLLDVKSWMNQGTVCRMTVPQHACHSIEPHNEILSVFSPFPFHK